MYLMSWGLLPNMQISSVQISLKGGSSLPGDLIRMLIVVFFSSSYFQRFTASFEQTGDSFLLTRYQGAVPNGQGKIAEEPRALKSKVQGLFFLTYQSCFFQAQIVLWHKQKKTVQCNRICNRTRLPFCFVVTEECRYQWAGNVFVEATDAYEWAPCPEVFQKWLTAMAKGSFFGRWHRSTYFWHFPQTNEIMTYLNITFSFHRFLLEHLQMCFCWTKLLWVCSLFALFRPSEWWHCLWGANLFYFHYKGWRATKYPQF